MLSRLNLATRCRAARVCGFIGNVRIQNGSLFRSLLRRKSTAARMVLNNKPQRKLEEAPARPVADVRTRSPPGGEETPLTETVRDFLAPSDFYKLLVQNRLDFFCGVPDSLLSNFCGYVTDHAPKTNHVITPNEGTAVALAAGYHLATRRFPVVYMQNSGFGNSVNPLLSLCDPKVYSVPMLLLVGWRGEPGKKDEPQHHVQGRLMAGLLSVMDIPFEVLPDYSEGAQQAINTAVHYLETRKGPYALLVKRQTFVPYDAVSLALSTNDHTLSREQALGLIVDSIGDYDVCVSCTGFASRELYEHRARRGQGHGRDFLMVGSMGHAGAIAVGVAMQKPSRQVVILDGDGGVLMHMGTLAMVATSKCKNIKHVVLNNGAHDSVGGQPTSGLDVAFPLIARACGYKHVFQARTAEEVVDMTKQLREVEGPAFMEILVSKGARKNLGRPVTSPLENKQDFMAFLDG